MPFAFNFDAFTDTNADTKQKPGLCGELVYQILDENDEPAEDYFYVVDNRNTGTFKIVFNTFN